MQLRLLFSLLFCSLMFSAMSQTSIGIIGTATPGGWDADTDMIQLTDSTWSLEIDLVAGEAKFRKDNAWDVNWGAADFPAGVGIQGGPNVPVPSAGHYTVTFNSNSGAYNFEIKSDIGIIGSATPNGWGNDTNMSQDAVDTNQYSITLRLVVGEAKFRANDDWAINWGAADFPAGVGVQDGPNIPVSAAGKYLINFNKSTGAYSFEEIVEFNVISLIGSGTAGGWDTDTDLTRDAGNPDLWKGTVTLIDGEVKFRANNAWALSWGDTLFPSGIAVLNGPNIPVVAGDYQVKFNIATGEYSFLLIGNYASVGIIGSATPGGWENETGMDQDPLDRSIWRKRLVLIDGEAKFRADNAWAINWGAGDFPTGIAEQDGANIPVPAGEYKITFNSTTGEYSFEELVVYNIIGLIGNSIPGNNWDADVLLTKDATNEFLFSLPTIDLVDAPSGGGIKFRANNDWAINWGAADFPIGVGTQDGSNILPVAGAYKVDFNTATGDYAFSDPAGSATANLLDPNVINISPNPAKDVLNIKISAEELQGDVRFTLYDKTGKQVFAQNMNVQELAKINITDLNTGNYLLQIAKGKTMVGKKVVIVK